MQILRRLAALWSDEEAVTSVEYALLLVTVALAAVVAFGHASEECSSVYNRTSQVLQDAMGAGCSSG
ncbi:MAG: hypothetical protein U9R79_19575 [Armatimonadota bacterium]|nr:hypothetical protein [Armatimonadota bacterium]